MNNGFRDFQFAPPLPIRSGAVVKSMRSWVGSTPNRRNAASASLGSLVCRMMPREMWLVKFASSRSEMRWVNRIGNTSSDLDSRPRRSISSAPRSEEHTSELQSRGHLVCRLLLEKKKRHQQSPHRGTH